MTKVIGLTGGIGSGKTTVARIFESLGVPVYIADHEAKKITESPEVLKIISDKFGNEVITQNHLDRKKLAEIVFQNPHKLQQLNEIIHPLVKQHFQLWLAQHPTAPFVIREAAILFESGSYKDCDKIITVIAPLQIRIQRVMMRDTVTYEEVVKRVANQWTDEQRIALSDYVIANETSENTKNQTIELFHKLTIR